MLNRVSLLLLLIPVLCTACGPSQMYREGRGFYSEDFSEVQVQAATKAGKVSKIGKFSFEASICGNYTTGLADAHLVDATLQHELPKMGANVAERVTAAEPVGNILFSFLLAPMGCSDWTISGQALLVDLPTPASPPELR